MDCLYHYCSNKTCFSMLDSQSFRLSDIRKSNDYRELSLFFPKILFEIDNLYSASPFPLRYRELNGLVAFSQFIRDSYNYWHRRYEDGDFSGFVFCLSEDPDVLSQWRGYADDGRGCCIGFSKELLNSYCKANKNVVRFEKVEYVTDNQLNDYRNKAAKASLKHLETLRTWTIENITHDDDDPETDLRMHYYFNYCLESVFIDTLRFKSDAFQEEKEWRFFLRNTAYKNPNWIYRDERSELRGTLDFTETVNFLNNRVDFRVTNDDIIPFVPVYFSEFPESPVIEIWTGPKNKITESDLNLFLKQKKFENRYKNTTIFQSRISYR